MTEWYLGDNWDKETQQMFEQKLKKSRGNYNKAQYLRIKGSSLLKSKHSQERNAGVELLGRVINEYPNEISNVMFAYEQLGDYFFFKEEYANAEFNYRRSISYYKQHGRSGSSGLGDIKLAETIFKASKSDKFLEVYNLLTDDFEKTGGELLLNDDIFRYYSVLAKISNSLCNKNEAKRYAQRAMQVSSIKEPQINSYPQVGIPKVSNEEINILNNILQG